MGEEVLLRVPEAARRLGLDGVVVYDLIARRELFAGKGKDGLVYVPESAIEDYKRRHTTSHQ
jgi:predicted DNA-binding transcriptional regulator AlpA